LILEIKHRQLNNIGVVMTRLSANVSESLKVNKMYSVSLSCQPFVIYATVNYRLLDAVTEWYRSKRHMKYDHFLI